MNSEWFEKVIKEQIKTCEDVLIGKAKEYATDDDRLHNFKNAAGMMSCNPKEALAGMMAKHTISVYDMCRNGKDYPIELWNEKITDHINYLFLLKAIVEEEIFHERIGTEKNATLNIQHEITKTKEIIDALKICSGDFVDEEDCIECPYYIYYRSGCVERLKENAAKHLEFFLKLQDPMGLNKEAPHDNT